MKSFFVFTVLLITLAITNAQTKMYINKTTGTDSIKLSEIKSISFKTILSDTVIAYWKLDELSGNSVSDVSGNSNIGAADTSALIVPGIIGNARTLSIPSNKQSIIIPHFPKQSIFGNNPFSIECFVKIQEYEYYGLGLIFKSGNYGLYTGSYGSSGYLQFFIPKDSTNTGFILQSDIQVPKNKWVHIAGTWNGSIAKLYIDYKLVKSQSYTTPMQGSSNPIIMGQRSLSVTPTSSNTLIDEVRISSVELQPDSFVK